ncbi:hypothetical protein LPBF_03410 [Flavobacterium crassostreae]|uniref:Uncharacterized protein n=1 Tax=Flavobacterium crassostreae TaxID=1763534 RepID=A0A1B9E7T0_9FLAO|nr:hypothetical protein LPBF_03410 [Flavobacterium crassostreae]
MKHDFLSINNSSLYCVVVCKTIKNTRFTSLFKPLLASLIFMRPQNIMSQIYKTAVSLCIFVFYFKP